MIFLKSATSVSCILMQMPCFANQVKGLFVLICRHKIKPYASYFNRCFDTAENSQSMQIYSNCVMLGEQVKRANGFDLLI